MTFSKIPKQEWLKIRMLRCCSALYDSGRQNCLMKMFFGTTCVRIWSTQQDHVTCVKYRSLFYRHTEQDSFITQKSCICWDIPLQPQCSEQCSKRCTVSAHWKGCKNSPLCTTWSVRWDYVLTFSDTLRWVTLQNTDWPIGRVTEHVSYAWTYSTCYRSARIVTKNHEVQHVKTLILGRQPHDNQKHAHVRTYCTKYSEWKNSYFLFTMTKPLCFICKLVIEDTVSTISGKSVSTSTYCSIPQQVCVDTGTLSSSKSGCDRSNRVKISTDCLATLIVILEKTAWWSTLLYLTWCHQLC